MRVLSIVLSFIIACILLSAPVHADGGCSATPPTSSWSVALTFVVTKAQITDDTFASSVVTAFASQLSSSLGISRDDVASAVSCGSATNYFFADNSLNQNYGFSYKVTLFIDHAALKEKIDTLTAPAAASEFIQIMKSGDFSQTFLPPFTLLVDSLTLDYTKN